MTHKMAIYTLHACIHTYHGMYPCTIVYGHIVWIGIVALCGCFKLLFFFTILAPSIILAYPSNSSV